MSTPFQAKNVSISSLSDGKLSLTRTPVRSSAFEPPLTSSSVNISGNRLNNNNAIYDFLPGHLEIIREDYLKLLYLKRRLLFHEVEPECTLAMVEHSLFNVWNLSIPK